MYILINIYLKIKNLHNKLDKYTNITYMKTKYTKIYIIKYKGVDNSVKKIFLSLFLAILTITFVILTSGAWANTIDKNKINEVKPFINVFDQNGNLIKSYTEKEMEHFYVNDNQLAVQKFGVQGAQKFPPVPKTYNFKKNTIKNNDWVKGGATFYDLKSIY